MKWALKIAAKIVLSRLPVNYSIFRTVGVFRHGYMNKSGYAKDVFLGHVDNVGGPVALRGKTCLELGPGDSLATAILGYALGAEKTYLLDVGHFADMRPDVYRELIEHLEQDGYDLEDVKGFTSIDDLLKRTRSVYLTDGLASLRSIPPGSVDFIWSQAVLEHVRVHEVAAVLSEMKRITADSGAMSHQIDYKDHLDASLNNMRFSTRVWESGFMARSGFYTNRIRHSQFLGLMENAGFRLVEIKPEYWPAVPLPRKKMAKEFRLLSDQDLRTRSALVVARPT